MFKLYSKIMCWVYINVWGLSPDMAEKIVKLQLKGYNHA